MNDLRIIELLNTRSEIALVELDRQYSKLYCSIIRNTLGNEADVDECANDVLLAVWNSIPPNCPDSLVAYVCKIAKRIGIDRYRMKSSQKRSTEYTVMLSELEGCLPGEELTVYENDSEEIKAVLERFIENLDPETEILFVHRYIMCESVAQLAAKYKLDENYISVKLYRARGKLKKELEKEGIVL